MLSLSLSDTIERFLTVCEDIYDNRNKSSVIPKEYLKDAIALYALRLHALRCEGRLDDDKYNDNEILALYLEILPGKGVPQSELKPWYALRDKLDELGMPTKKPNGDVCLDQYRSLFWDVTGEEHICEALRENIANMRRITNRH